MSDMMVCLTKAVCSPSYMEAEAEGSLELGSSRPAWTIQQGFISQERKKKKGGWREAWKEERKRKREGKMSFSTW